MTADAETSTARDVMDPNPSVLQSTDRIADGVHVIMRHRYRNLPVVSEDGHFLGVFGVNCLLRLVLPKAVLLKDGLGISIHPDTPLLETLLILYRNRISIPVVEKDDGRLVGMISYFDAGERILAQEL